MTALWVITQLAVIALAAIGGATLADTLHRAHQRGRARLRNTR